MAIHPNPISLMNGTAARALYSLMLLTCSCLRGITPNCISGRALRPAITALQFPQKLTLNLVSQAGQVMSRCPGRFVIRILLSQEGHRTSAFGTLALISNWLSQVEHCRFAGLRSTPEMSTELHDGQATFSSAQARLVTGCSTRTLALHNKQAISPNSGGRRPSHFGHERSGGAIADSTVNSSSMYSPRAV
jgi:hypothetical protein